MEEKIIIGHILLNANIQVYANCLLKIKPIYFQNSLCARLFEFMKKQVEAGTDQIDFLKLSKDSGIKLAVISKLSSVASKTNIDLYNALDVFLKETTRRGFLKNITKMLNSNKDLNEITTDIVKEALTHNQEEEKDSNIWHEYEVYQKRKYGQIAGLSTGYPAIDDITDGLIRSHVWVIGAFTKMGKSYMALNILSNLMLNEDAKIMFFSLEMSRLENMLRLLALRSGISVRDIRRRKKLSRNKLKELELAEAEIQWALEEQGLTIYDNIRTTGQIYTEVKKIQAVKPIDVVFVDYIQLLQGAGETYERIMGNAMELQAMAKDLNVCVVAISQINLESHKQGLASTTAGYKGAGDIEHVVDIGVRLHRYQREENLELSDNMVFHVRHNRFGMSASVLLRFDWPSGSIKELQCTKAEAEEELKKFI